MKQKRKQFVVIGLGSFGMSVAETLSRMDKQVLAIDINEDLVQDVADIVTQAVQADAREEEVLQKLGIQDFDVAIVAIGNNMEASIFVTLLLKELGVPFIISKAINPMHQKALSRIGADRVIQPEIEMGVRVARNLSTTNLIDYIELSEEYSIFEFSCPSSWVGHTVRELDLRKKYGVTLLGIKNNKEVQVVIEPTMTFTKDDIVILLGDKKVFQNQFESN